MARSKIPCTCKTCGVLFYGWTGRANYFCSQACYHVEDRRRALARFWARIQKTDYCWVWPVPFDKDGYGKSGIGAAHQVSWIETHGPVPDGLQICHKCNNPSCVNPDHLYLGTSADNMRDRQSVGHYDRGESHPMAILNEATVLKIRSLYVPRKNGITALGRQFGIAPTTVHAIVTQKIWKHI